MGSASVDWCHTIWPQVAKACGGRSTPNPNLTMPKLSHIYTLFIGGVCHCPPWQICYVPIPWQMGSKRHTVLLRPSVHWVWHVTLVNTIWHSSLAKFLPWRVPKAVPFVLNRQFSHQIRQKSILSSVHSGLWPVTKYHKYLIHCSLWPVTEHSVVIVQYYHTVDRSAASYWDLGITIYQVHK
jgi:hypothetical protein